MPPWKRELALVAPVPVRNIIFSPRTWTSSSTHFNLHLHGSTIVVSVSTQSHRTYEPECVAPPWKLVSGTTITIFHLRAPPTCNRSTAPAKLRATLQPSSSSCNL
ncbi:hypothetical protein DEO72_LG10g1905 [Vigna unguiculata]|uniref:Uncharacterized protein n=1 Tax=Vigna unguiculata TaxID=3917 RepID=A0A4D6ND45_VIGUN|nr:hypothetical protein DEO72_LG10g1905 [Vigna unguiculata]